MILPTNKHYMGKDPSKDWALIFIVTCSIGLLFVFVGVYSYVSVDNDISLGLSQSTSLNLPFNPESLRNAIKLLDDRDADRGMISNGGVHVSDPSI